MSRIRFTGLALWALFCAAAPAVRAQVPAPAPDGPALTLREALDEVRARHPELAAIRAQYEADRLKPEAERFLTPPMLEAQAVEWPLDTANPGNAKLMVMLGQELPGRGKRDARVALARREAEMTRTELAVREQDLLQRVRKAYAELQLAREVLATYHESVDLLRGMADVAEARYSAGRGGQQDVLKAILERSMLEEQIVMADEQARMAEAALNVLLDRPADAPVGAIDRLAGESRLPASADALRLALEWQPELAAVDADVARREAASAVASRERAADYIVQGGFMVMPDETNAWTARVGVTWPKAPWARGRVDALEREGTAQIEAARARRKALENELRLGVREAWVRADAAARRAELLRTSLVPQAQHALDVTRVSYQADRVDFLDVIDNQRRLLDARLGVARALVARDLALADLWRAVGRDPEAQP